MQEAITETIPILQPDGATVYVSKQEALGEASAHCIFWLFDHPQILALGAAAVALCCLMGGENPKRRKRPRKEKPRRSR
jgi:hypothetical protein